MRNESLIEWVLRHEAAIRTAIYEQRNDPGTHYGGGRGGNSISNPTEEQGIRNATELEVVSIPIGGRGGAEFRLSLPERWIKVCDKVRTKYAGSVYAEIIVQCYDTGESKSTKEIIDTIGVSRTSFFVLKNEIITFAEGLAIGLGIYMER